MENTQPEDREEQVSVSNGGPEKAGQSTPPDTKGQVDSISNSNNQSSQPQTSTELTGLNQDNLMAALSYLGILVLVPLFTRRDNPFVLFHVKQGLVILAGFIIASLAVPWIAIIGNLLWLALLVATVAGFIQAIQGKRWKIPGVGDLAEKFNI